MMMRVLGWLRDEQRGMTLAELALSMAVLILVSGAFLTVVQSVQQGFGRQGEHSIANDQARLAIEQLDREIRSGSILYDPALEAPAYYSLRVYTQANAPSRSAGSLCVQWRISARELQRRDWVPGDPSMASAWRTIATNVVNLDLAKRAFEIDPDPVKSGRTLDVVLMVDGDPEDATISPVRIQTSITGRNTALGYPSGVCTPAPS